MINTSKQVLFVRLRMEDIKCYQDGKSLRPGSSYWTCSVHRSLSHTISTRFTRLMRAQHLLALLYCC